MNKAAHYFVFRLSLTYFSEAILEVKQEVDKVKQELLKTSEIVLGNLQTTELLKVSIHNVMVALLPVVPP